MVNIKNIYFEVNHVRRSESVKIMDPFEKIPAEIHDNLLQYFSVWDVLDVLSLVSKSWYEAVATSSVCQKKIKLHLKSKRKNDFPERIEVLKWMSRKGGRGYQHLHVNCLLDEGISEEVWKLLEATAGSVETINIRSIKLFPEYEVKKFAMPKLEQLQLMFIPRQAMNAFLISSASFQKLILRNEFPLCYDGIDYTPSETTVISTRICMKRNQKLEELELQGRPNFFSFFHQDLTQFVSFHLKKLVAKVEISAEKILPQHEENFVTFLKHQSESLEHVYIDSCSSRIVQFVFNKMPALKFIRLDIELREPNNFVIKDLNIKPNDKITQLELPYIVLLEDNKAFLDLVPNVEEILVGHMTPRLIDYAILSLPKLKTIVYRYDDCAGGCEKYYEEFKRENPEANRKVEMNLCNDFL